MLADVELAYQNLESVELGVTTVDHYFDTLGGISRAVCARRAAQASPVYIGDQTSGDGKVRTLAEQVGARDPHPHAESEVVRGHAGARLRGRAPDRGHVTNTLGWSATTGQVAPWVYQQLTETFVLDEEMRERLADAQSDGVRQASRTA